MPNTPSSSVPIVPSPGLAARREARGGWDDDDRDEAPPRRLSAQQARELREREPPLSPWRVVALQAAVGAAAALAGALLASSTAVGWSVLWGAMCVVLPGALMARGMTSRLTGANPGVSAVSFMLWEFVKIAASVAMLAIAPRVVRPLVWPALLAGLVVGLKVYWLALLWRPRPR